MADATPETVKPHPVQITPMAIEYNGVRYRSALEADWAATFTDLGVHFEYEPQPYRLPSGAVYDCDFYLPNQHTYCEAKGPHNQRLWKPAEFAAAIEATEYPNAFMVLILRAAGPHGGLTWENAGSGPNPKFVRCRGCEHFGFATYDNTWGQWFCRRCDSTEFYSVTFPDSENSVGPYHPMGHAPRKAA